MRFKKKVNRERVKLKLNATWKELTQQAIIDTTDDSLDDKFLNQYYFVVYIHSYSKHTIN